MTLLLGHGHYIYSGLSTLAMSKSFDQFEVTNHLVGGHKMDPLINL